jgi:hypothetical protein
MKAADAEGYEPEDAWIMRIGETRKLAGSWPSNA